MQKRRLTEILFTGSVTVMYSMLAEAVDEDDLFSRSTL